jgi:hypothetical protein
MPVSGRSWGTNLPPEARTFPADAQQSKLAWKEIIHAIYTRYPNVKIIYNSTKGAMYMSATATKNPEFIGGPLEPFNHDAALMEASSPISRLVAGKIVPLDAHSMLAITAMQALPAAAERVPNAGFGKVAARRLASSAFGAGHVPRSHLPQAGNCAIQ